MLELIKRAYASFDIITTRRYKTLLNPLQNVYETSLINPSLSIILIFNNYLFILNQL